MLISSVPTKNLQNLLIPKRSQTRRSRSEFRSGSNKCNSKSPDTSDLRLSKCIRTKRECKGLVALNSMGPGYRNNASQNLIFGRRRLFSNIKKARAVHGDTNIISHHSQARTVFFLCFPSHSLLILT